MKKVLFFTIVILFSSFKAAAPLESARLLFTKLDKGEKYVDSLINISGRYVSSPVMQSYNGAANTAKAQYVGNVFSKYSQAKKGLGIMNKAASRSPKNVEVRFVRYCTESNIPSVMPFSSHVKEDKSFIINNLSNKHQHYSAIKAFMLKFGDLTDAEKKKLNG